MRRRFEDHTERVLYLRSIPVAATQPANVLHVIASQLHEREFEKGAAIQREGEPVTSLHLFVAGKVKLLRGGAEVGALAPPQSIGFLDILARGEATYDAITDEPTRSLELKASALLEVMEDHFSLFTAALRYVGERLLAELFDLPSEALSLPFTEEPEPPHELDLVERIFYLRKISAFARANVNALTVMSRGLIERRYEPGEVLFRSGEPSGPAPMVVSGRILCKTPDGTKTFRYGPGTIAGGIESLADRPRWFTATAETRLVVLEGNTDKLLDVFEDNFVMAADFLAAVSTYLKMILSRKVAAGQSTLGVLRDVSALGAVPVGA
jgi:CRP-like cAMP-binding protein